MAREEILYVRLTKEEKDRLRKAAKDDYMYLSNWVRKVLLMKVDEGLKERP